ncbi:hypothetical protein PP175_08790 [Aneurinibacillus sp. Ricciae_BoGa-3]|uniref:hypothetical protein n=1 Tax=Aneurinibacillus sp. Ricciae_BoGa-3 TaxID=3022697 RepID=UPI00233F9353|nr:hypothetical protein [Aneurinibacillus sp. Ricciae_BoGa-3]WCK55994.1 hypothetical protein PP175_08790 [Aneurinibacillus sp. Ricciae_BoGa-3]
MTVLAWGIFVINFITGFFAYLSLTKHKKVIECHTGMNIAMTATGVLGLIIGITLAIQFPNYYTSITIVSTFLCIIVGIFFGTLGDLQTIVAGISSGIMMGFMSPMIGAMTPSPIVLLLFTTLICVLSFWLLCYSVKIVAKMSSEEVEKSEGF